MRRTELGEDGEGTATTTQGQNAQMSNIQKHEPSTSQFLEASKGEEPPPPSNDSKQQHELSASNNPKGNKKKRGRERDKSGAGLSREERDARDRRDYYQRLLHSCTKHVKKSLKEVKGLECTKLARNLKKFGGVGGVIGGHRQPSSERRSDGDDHSATSSDDNEEEEVQGSRTKERNSQRTTNASAVDRLENNYKQLKALEVEVAVSIVLKRLGILHLDPNFGGGGAAGTSKDAAAGAPAAALTTPTEAEWVERLLKHAKMRACMEKWNDQVTEYRRWCLRQDEMRNGSSGGGGNAAASRNKKQPKRRRTDAKRSAAEAATTAASFQHSVFATLGGGEGVGSDDDDSDKADDDDGDYYGPGGGGTTKGKEKKNRPGQRARKAKAEAIRAKEQGVPRTTSQSLNWREPKKKNRDDAQRPDNQRRRHHGNQGEASLTAGAPSPPSSNRSAQPQKSSEDEKAHPSWQAKSLKSNTGGIVAFQGTKITFD